MDLAPMKAAIQSGDAARVRELIAAEPALVSARTEQGVSMISFACYCRQPKIAAILAQCGAFLDIFDACAIGDLDRVRVLLDEFPESICSYSPDGFYPLGLAAFFGHRNLVGYLLTAGANVNQSAKNALKAAPLHAAVSNGDFETVRTLIEHGADVNASQQMGYTALHGAAGAGRIDLIELLLQHGADPNLVAEGGKTAGMVAEERGQSAAAARLGAALV
jgi:ankyrin repeat protein